MKGEMSDAELLRDLPRGIAQDIARAAYEAKVREMEDRERMRKAAPKTETESSDSLG